MNVALRTPPMTREEFFAWAEAREERYEFDGFRPVLMRRGNIRHGRITLNLIFALEQRLADGRYFAIGPDVGLPTVDGVIRYPDALVSGTTIAGTDYCVADAVVVFEVLSPSSGRIDHIIKPREYAAVPSILRYVIVEQSSVGATVLSRVRSGQDWTATTLMEGDTLHLPEIGVALPLTELYARVDLPEGTAPGAEPT